jgi:RNA polymerase sigma-70 factor (ECF subfamily)
VDLGALYAAHAPAVARWAARLGGTDVDVDDVVHDVFVVVERRMKTFRGASSLTTWLYGITANVVRHARRKNRLRRWLDDGDALDRLVSSEKTPIELIEQQESIAHVRSVLDRLSEKYRTVLVLHEIEGLSGVEIAERTGVKPSTVWVRLHRARMLFKEALLPLVLIMLALAGTAYATASGVEWIRAHALSPTPAPPIDAPPTKHGVHKVRSKRIVPRARVSIDEQKMRIRSSHLDALEVKTISIGAYALEDLDRPLEHHAIEIEAPRKVSAPTVTEEHAPNSTRFDPPRLLFDHQPLFLRPIRATELDD